MCQVTRLPQCLGAEPGPGPVRRSAVERRPEDDHVGIAVRVGVIEIGGVDAEERDVGTELGAGSDNNSNDSAIIQALRHGASDSLNQTGQQVVRRSLNIQPTLTIRPGFPVRVIVNRDLRLEPYTG